MHFVKQSSILHPFHLCFYTVILWLYSGISSCVCWSSYSFMVKLLSHKKLLLCSHNSSYQSYTKAFVHRVEPCQKSQEQQCNILINMIYLFIPGHKLSGIPSIILLLHGDIVAGSIKILDMILFVLDSANYFYHK